MKANWVDALRSMDADCRSDFKWVMYGEPDWPSRCFMLVVHGFDFV